MANGADAPPLTTNSPFLALTPECIYWNFADEQTDDLLGLTLIQHLFEFADFNMDKTNQTRNYIFFFQSRICSVVTWLIPCRGIS